MDDKMIYKQTAYGLCLVIIVGMILSGCNLVRPGTQSPIPPAPSSTQESGSAVPTGISTSPVASTSALNPSDSGGMQITILNLTDGGTTPAAMNPDGSPLVKVQFKVTGMAPLMVTMEVNGFPAVDALGHTLQAENNAGTVPFSGEIPWSPANGGGEYTLVATAMTGEKQFAQATVHVTVTGIAGFTPTPPPPDLAGAQRRISELIQQNFNVSIPKPSVYRFDSTLDPALSRWIGSAYYKGTRHYIDLYDDTHYAWSNTPYSDPAHRTGGDNWVLCRPVGTFRVLTIFVDYGNTGTDRNTALAKVPVVVDWLNGLYTNFAISQGQSQSFMHVEADAAFVSPPPSPGDFLTAAQVLSLTGKDPSAYDFLMQIDLDANAILVKRNFFGIIESGGGVALQGCGSGNKTGIMSIYSSIYDSSSLEGTLVMDFNHELSHLFGMMDNWPRISAAGPDGLTIDDWIPYVIFGWTDSDGDGIPEIIDPTPYGTTN
jgi:hypothetical protein